MDAILALIEHSLIQVWVTFTHNWPFLIVSILVAVVLKLYLDPQKVSAFLIRHQRAGVWGATAAAVGTPLCSCGTTALVLGMMASSMPWAPIIAFMVASPLTSPEELVYSAGLFGWPFALTFFIASICLGLLGGLAGAVFEKRGWLKNQARFADSPRTRSRPEPAAACGCQSMPQPQLVAASCCAAEAAPASGIALSRISLPARSFHMRTTADSCGCSGQAPVAAAVLSEAAPQACSCSATASQPAALSSPRFGAASASRASAPASQAVTPARFFSEALEVGKRLLPMFFGFAFIGYFLNGLIPTAWVTTIFGQGHAYSVPLAAALGLPLYINTEASLPLVRALIDGGMSQGAALAFLITGAGTSIGAVTGALTIARWRVIALIVAVLWVGAVATGFIFNLMLAAHLF